MASGSSRPLNDRWVSLLLVAALALTGCGGSLVVPAQAWDPEGAEAFEESSPGLTTDQLPNSGPSNAVEDKGEETELLAPTETPTEEPENTALNPLTGLAVDDANVLCQPPLLVAVSNFPPSSRPQSGLSTSAHVWETYIGKGMTRFLAVFYGDYRQSLDAMMNNRLAEGSENGILIGPVRSGRVVFEDIKALFPKAHLITAGGSSQVLAQLSNRSSVYNQDPDDINSAGIGADDLRLPDECSVDPTMYGDLTFRQEPPIEGSTAEEFRIVYNLFNQVGWQYDPEAGVYLRSQDRADGSGDLYPAVEALTGEQLAFENVLVLWARHRYVTATIIEMELVYVRDRYGLLFRDGQVYEINWSTPGGRLQIHDEAGESIPLKPGRTFFEVVSYPSTWRPEGMVVRYHNPAGP